MCKGLKDIWKSLQALEGRLDGKLREDMKASNYSLGFQPGSWTSILIHWDERVGNGLLFSALRVMSSASLFHQISTNFIYLTLLIYAPVVEGWSNGPIAGTKLNCFCWWCPSMSLSPQQCSQEHLHFVFSIKHSEIGCNTLGLEPAYTISGDILCCVHMSLTYVLWPKGWC